MDIYVLVGLLAMPPVVDEPWTQMGFAQRLHVPQSALTRSLQRLAAVSLVDRTRRAVNHVAAEGLLVHGVPYLLPAGLGPPARGVPTAYSAPPLCDLLSSESAIVWADDLGNMLGTTLVPLHASAPQAAREHPELHAMLALVDALRVGRARDRALAARELHARIKATLV